MRIDIVNPSQIHRLSNTHYSFEMKSAILSNIPLTKAMSPAEQAKVANSTRRILLRKGQGLPETKYGEETFYFLEDGLALTIAELECYDESVRSIIGPGDYYGELKLAGHVPHNDSLVAVTNQLSLLELDVDVFEQILKTNTELMYLILVLIKDRYLNLHSRFETLHVKRSVDLRISGLIYRLGMKYGKDIGGEVFFEKGILSQDDIAMLVSTTRQTATSSLSKLSGMGLISYDRERIIIRDPIRLKRVCQSGKLCDKN